MNNIDKADNATCLRFVVKSTAIPINENSKRLTIRHLEYSIGGAGGCLGAILTDLRITYMPLFYWVSGCLCVPDKLRKILIQSKIGGVLTPSTPVKGSLLIRGETN